MSICIFAFYKKDSILIESKTNRKMFITKGNYEVSKGSEGSEGSNVYCFSILPEHLHTYLINHLSLKPEHLYLI